MNKKIFSIFLLLLITIDSIPCKNLISFAIDTTIATITSDSEQDLLNAVAKLNKSGGIIYIDTSVINISSKNSLGLLVQKQEVLLANNNLMGNIQE